MSFSTRIRNFSAALIMLAGLACTAASCGPDKQASQLPQPHCAFSDPQFVISLGICDAVAEYYVAHHEWPLSKSQLEEQWNKMMVEAKKQAPEEKPDEDGPTFFRRFTVLELGKSGENLALHYRFKIDGKTVNQRAIFRPGPTADDILRSAADASEPLTEE